MGERHLGVEGLSYPEVLRESFFTVTAELLRGSKLRRSSLSMLRNGELRIARWRGLYLPTANGSIKLEETVTSRGVLGFRPVETRKITLEVVEGKDPHTPFLATTFMVDSAANLLQVNQSMPEQLHPDVDGMAAFGIDEATSECQWEYLVNVVNNLAYPKI